MMTGFKRSFLRNLTNIPGFRTKRKIVVFESDDWGMIRMASKEAYNRLLKKGYQIDTSAYNSNDALESNNDILGLAEVLQSVRDKNGRFAKFTINNIVANPDFIKIKENNFQEYFYEPFTITLKKSGHSDRVMKLYREGIDANIFQMQFHGREHVNVNRWMQALQKKNKTFVNAFEENMFTVTSGINSTGRRDFLDAFGLDYEKEFESIESIIKTGISLFNTVWGYLPDSFIAPCYTWPSEMETILKNSGIKYIQGSYVQIEPKERLELSIHKKYHYQGQRNNLGLYFLIRNAFFEPAQNKIKSDQVGDTLNQIRTAFKWRKPAIISSHRMNFIGSINEANRSDNLKLLKNLLKEIIQLYPDVEFMSTDDLGHLIEENQ